jgi:Ca2+-binding RTX toxin-like protein
MTQTLNGTAGNDILTGTDPGDPTNPDGIDIINGGGSADWLIGLGGDDIIEGGAGSDKMEGGAGFDTLSYAHAGGGVVVYLGLGGLGGEASGDQISGFEALIGSDFNDQLVGDVGADWIDGGAGSDFIGISGGADQMFGGDGMDYVNGSIASSAIEVNLTTGVGQGWAAGCTFSSFEAVAGSIYNDILTANLNLGTLLAGGHGNDTLNGGDGDDTLYGDVGYQFSGSGTDTLNGGAGNDMLAGGELGDVLNGGFGIDTAIYSSSSAAVTVNLAFGTASGGDADGDTLTSIENVTGSSFNDMLVGSTAANTLDGGDGTDQVIYAFSGAAVSINLATNANTGSDAQGDILLAVENVTGSAFDDTLVGNTAVNVLAGGDGNDVLDGAAGGDTLDGGAGRDTATYAQSNAAVTIDLIFGANTGGHAQGDVLQGIEDLVGSAFGDTLIGDGGGNVIDGGAGDDLIVGYDGADTIRGGAGIDTIYFYNAAVTVNLATGMGTGGDAQGDTYQNVENVVGSALNDTLIGNTGANALYGDDGDDKLTGHGGADVLDGGFGIDTVYYDISAAGVVVSLATGTGAGGDAEGDTVSNFENITGSAFADKLFGWTGANALNGGAGDDTLRGGAGADVLDGGQGSDFANYQGSAAAVTVDLLAHTNSGGDAQGDTLANIENLYGSGNDDHLSGDAGRNVIGGENGNDTLAGNGGDDAMNGENGNDSLDGGDGADRLVGGAGTDTIHGGAGIDSIDAGADKDIVFGDDGNDGLHGGAGDDVLTGGAGADLLQGAAGNDIVAYGAIGDSTVAAAGKDTVFDFTTGDHIDLSAIDADGNSGNGDTAFSFITTNFTGHAGQLRVVTAGATQVVYVDTNGDRFADLGINVRADHALTAADFAL